VSRFVPKDGRPHGAHDGDGTVGGELSLLSLPGVGRSKAQALINAGYHSLRSVADTPIEELQQVPGLGPKTARELRTGALEALSELERERSRPTVVPHPRSSEVAADDEAPPAKLSLADFLGSDAGAHLRVGPAIDQTPPAADAEEELASPDAAPPENEEPVDVHPSVHEQIVGPDSAPSENRERLDVHLSVHLDSSLLAEFDRELARAFEVIPMQRIGNELLVASESELSEQQLKEISERAGIQVRTIPSQVANLDATLRTLFDDNTMRSRSKGLGEILIDLGLLTEQQLGQALAHQMRENNPFFRPVLSIDESLLQVVPEGMARTFNIVPLFRTADTLLLATSEHLTEEALRKIEEKTELAPTFVVVEPSELQDTLTACYQVRRHHELRQMWLGEILVSRGLITRQELDTCLAAQPSSRQKIGQVLVENGFISEDALYPILADKLGMEYRRFEQQEVDHQLTYLVSERFAERNLILPLRLDYDEDVLEVAISDPTNLQVRDMLESVAEAQGAQLKLVLAGPTRLRDSISYSYNFNKQMEVDLEDLEIETDGDWEESDHRADITVTEDLPKMRRIVNKLLYEAVTEGASDIHIENLETRTQVRFRIDGILHERTTPINKGNIQKIISVLKIDSGLNIAERRRAQDGVFKMRIGKDRNIDFRINVHATQFGEDAVIRVLDRARNLLGLGDLGFAPTVQSRYEALVTNPQGLILITGPTGSGKTTTLYSSLAHLNTGDKKIVTAEDPVEYHLDGITQYQVNNFIGNTFAEYTRRFLRKDPDIILVGSSSAWRGATAPIAASRTPATRRSCASSSPMETSPRKRASCTAPGARPATARGCADAWGCTSSGRSSGPPARSSVRETTKARSAAAPRSTASTRSSKTRCARCTTA